MTEVAFKHCLANVAMLAKKASAFSMVAVEERDGYQGDGYDLSSGGFGLRGIFVAPGL